MERKGELIDRSIRDGDALVLSQMLDPRIDQESFQIEFRSISFTKQGPTDRAIAQTLFTQAPHCPRKLRATFGIDKVFHRDQGRSAIHRSIAGQRRCRPGQSWTYIQALCSLERKEGDRGKPYDKSARRSLHRDGNADAL